MIYYAHSMRIYNTEEEKKQLNLIKSKYNKEIFNPNGELKSSGRQAMLDCFEAIKKSEMVIFSEYQDYIGRGVYEELKLALKLGLPVKRLVKTLLGYKLENIKGIVPYDTNDWIIKYGMVKT